VCVSAVSLDCSLPSPALSHSSVSWLLVTFTCPQPLLCLLIARYLHLLSATPLSLDCLLPSPALSHSSVSWLLVTFTCPQPVLLLPSCSFSTPVVFPFIYTPILSRVFFQIVVVSLSLPSSWVPWSTVSAVKSFLFHFTWTPALFSLRLSFAPPYAW